MTAPILLIDGDQFLYRACAAVEHEIRWDLENHVLVSNSVEAYEKAKGGIEKVIEEFRPSAVRLAFTKTESFRKDFFPAYKDNRVQVRKPMCYVDTREKLEEDYASLAIDTLEADDILGIWATRDDKEYIIVSDDKDLKTIPGKLYRQGKLEEISPEQADYNWFFQTLIGDTADNFPGCPGIGEKKAPAFIDVKRPLKDNWTAVVTAFEKAGLTADDALIQARCARILRASDWDSKNKEIIHWTP